MTESRKRTILDLLVEAIANGKTRWERAKVAAKDFSEQSRSSWSIGGDRAHAENTVEMAKRQLLDAEKLCQEIKSAPDTPPEKVTPPCFLVLDYRSEKGDKTTPRLLLLQ